MHALYFITTSLPFSFPGLHCQNSRCWRDFQRKSGAFKDGVGADCRDSSVTWKSWHYFGCPWLHSYSVPIHFLVFTLVWVSVKHSKSVLFLIGIFQVTLIAILPSITWQKCSFSETVVFSARFLLGVRTNSLMSCPYASISLLLVFIGSVDLLLFCPFIRHSARLSLFHIAKCCSVHLEYFSSLCWFSFHVSKVGQEEAINCASLLHQSGLQVPAKCSCVSWSFPNEHLSAVMATDFLYLVSLTFKS